MAGAKVDVGAAEGASVSVVVGGLASVLLVVGDVAVDEAGRTLVGVAVAAGWPCEEQALATTNATRTVRQQMALSVVRAATVED